MVSTGMIFLVGGGIGFAACMVAAVVCTVFFRRSEKRLDREIWEEYQ